MNWNRNSHAPLPRRNGERLPGEALYFRKNWSPFTVLPIYYKLTGVQGIPTYIHTSNSTLHNNCIYWILMKARPQKDIELWKLPEMEWKYEYLISLRFYSNTYGYRKWKLLNMIFHNLFSISIFEMSPVSKYIKMKYFWTFLNNQNYLRICRMLTTKIKKMRNRKCV